jgi:hypothetical protein
MAAATHRPSAKKREKKLAVKPDEKQSSLASFIIAHKLCRAVISRIVYGPLNTAGE